MQTTTYLPDKAYVTKSVTLLKTKTRKTLILLELKGSVSVSVSIEKTERECSLSLSLSLCFKWCHQESNRGHMDFQSIALPTELWHLLFGLQIYNLKSELPKLCHLKIHQNASDELFIPTNSGCDDWLLHIVSLLTCVLRMSGFFSWNNKSIHPIIRDYGWMEELKKIPGIYSLFIICSSTILSSNGKLPELKMLARSFASSAVKSPVISVLPPEISFMTLG